MVKVSDMGNYGCYPDCVEKMTKPLFAEAHVNLMRRRPMTSLVAHSKLILKLVNLNCVSKGDIVSVLGGMKCFIPSPCYAYLI